MQFSVVVNYSILILNRLYNNSTKHSYDPTYKEVLRYSYTFTSY